MISTNGWIDTFKGTCADRHEFTDHYWSVQLGGFALLRCIHCNLVLEKHLPH